MSLSLVVRRPTDEAVKLSLLCAFCLVAAQAHAFDPAKDRFIDKGACPFECCTYGSWRTVRETKLLAAPDAKAEQTGVIPAQVTVNAITGEVHSVPSRFIVSKQNGKYEPGDVVWVLNYYGEGYFRVWFEGESYNEDLDFSPYGGGAGKRCEKPKYCWGELEEELQLTWWIRVRGPEGLEGWTNAPGNSSGQDACR